MNSRLRACMSIGTSILPIWRVYSASTLPVPAVWPSLTGPDSNDWKASTVSPLGEPRPRDRALRERDWRREGVLPEAWSGRGLFDSQLQGT